MKYSPWMLAWVLLLMGTISFGVGHGIGVYVNHPVTVTVNVLGGVYTSATGVNAAVRDSDLPEEVKVGIQEVTRLVLEGHEMLMDALVKHLNMEEE